MADELLMRRLLDATRGLAAKLDPETILERILSSARELTDARYAALGILDGERSGLEHFLTIGIDEHTRAAIGAPPSGRGLLGALIEDPRPLRLRDLGHHPHSYGFPAGHPVMRSFLGVPIVIGGQAWGNLYLADKPTGEFTEADEEATVILAEWAATALESSMLYRSSEQRRLELEHALRGLEATRDVMFAIGSEVELGHTVELIAKRARALLDARSVLVLMPEDGELLIAATAGYSGQRSGRPVPTAISSLTHAVIERGSPLRVDNVGEEYALQGHELGAHEGGGALLVSLSYRGKRLGVLAAFDRGPDRTAFTDDDERLLDAFAASAAAALAIASNRSSLATSDFAFRRSDARV